MVADSSGNVVKKIINYDSFGNILNDSAPAFEAPFGFAEKRIKSILDP